MVSASHPSRSRNVSAALPMASRLSLAALPACRVRLTPADAVDSDRAAMCARVLRLDGCPYCRTAIDATPLADPVDCSRSDDDVGAEVSPPRASSTVQSAQAEYGLRTRR